MVEKDVTRCKRDVLQLQRDGHARDIHAFAMRGAASLVCGSVKLGHMVAVRHVFAMHEDTL